MKLSLSAIAVASISLSSSSVLGATYSVTDSIVGTGFYNSFEFEAIPDPTNGRVNYVNAATAKAENLTFAAQDTFILRADSTSTLTASGPGRNSVRIRSKEVYSTHVAVFNIRHMPQGCGTWPAVWETDEDGWPDGGEIDILEGVNDQGPNEATVHTSAGCTMPAQAPMTGNLIDTNCDVNVDNATGCAVDFPTDSSYGPPFNAIGGGWYVIERTSSFIKVWFWARNDPTTPNDVQSGSNTVNTDQWGTPAAFFPNTTCNYAKFFDQHNIIINLTFCGDWAGTSYSDSGCPSTCIDFVNNNPKQFLNAYFDFASIQIYQ